MDKVTQVMFEEILRGQEELKKLILNHLPKEEIKKAIKKPGVKLASDAQIEYARRLGADPWEGITHQEISELIDEGKARLENKEETKKVDEWPKTGETDPFKEETEQKPLTQEEIDALGEDAFM